MKYRKTALIEASLFDGTADSAVKHGLSYDGAENRYFVRTLEGPLYAKAGDMIATGVKGEKWAIDGEIFKASYEAVVE